MASEQLPQISDSRVRLQDSPNSLRTILDIVSLVFLCDLILIKMGRNLHFKNCSIS